MTEHTNAQQQQFGESLRLMLSGSRARLNERAKTKKVLGEGLSNTQRLTDETECASKKKKGATA